MKKPKSTAPVFTCLVTRLEVTPYVTVLENGQAVAALTTEALTVFPGQPFDVRAIVAKIERDFPQAVGQKAKDECRLK